MNRERRAGFLFLILVSLLFCLWAENRMIETIPDTVSLHNTDELISQAMLSHCSSASGTSDYLAYGTANTACAGENGVSIRAQMVVTAGDLSLLPLHYIDGACYEPSRLVEENTFVMIDEALAVQLYFTNLAAGKALWLNGKRYTVCAVVAAATTPAEQLAGNGLSIVYLPDSPEDGINLTHLLVSANEITGESQLNDFVAAEFGEYPSALLYTSEHDLRTGVQCCRIATAVFAALALLRLFFASDRIRKFSGLYRLRFVFFASVAAGGVCMLLAWFPHAWLPESNVFDLASYWKLLVATVQQQNYVGGVPYWVNVGQLQLVFSGALILLFALPCLFWPLAVATGTPERI